MLGLRLRLNPPFPVFALFYAAQPRRWLLGEGESGLGNGKLRCFLTDGDGKPRVSPRRAVRTEMLRGDGAAGRSARYGREEETRSLCRWRGGGGGGGDLSYYRRARGPSIVHQESGTRARMCNRIKERTHARQCGMVALLCNSRRNESNKTKNATERGEISRRKRVKVGEVVMIQKKKRNPVG